MNRLHEPIKPDTKFSGYVCYLPISYDVQLFACLPAYWPDGFSTYIERAREYSIQFWKVQQLSQKVNTQNARACVCVCAGERERPRCDQFSPCTFYSHRKPDQTEWNEFVNMCFSELFFFSFIIPDSQSGTYSVYGVCERCVCAWNCIYIVCTANSERVSEWASKQAEQTTVVNWSEI